MGFQARAKANADAYNATRSSVEREREERRRRSHALRAKAIRAEGMGDCGERDELLLELGRELLECDEVAGHLAGEAHVGKQRLLQYCKKHWMPIGEPVARLCEQIERWDVSAFTKASWVGVVEVRLSPFFVASALSPSFILVLLFTLAPSLLIVVWLFLTHTVPKAWLKVF